MRRLKLNLIEKSLEKVLTQGWNDSALIASAKELNLSPPIIYALFPKGALDLFCESFNVLQERMLIDIPPDTVLDRPESERIYMYLKLRLGYVLPYKHVWGGATHLYVADPLRVNNAILNTIDTVCRASGDQTTFVT